MFVCHVVQDIVFCSLKICQQKLKAYFLIRIIGSNSCLSRGKWLNLRKIRVFNPQTEYITKTL